MRALRIASLLCLALLQAGCADVEVKRPPGGFWSPEVIRHVPAAAMDALARAKSCCASLAELPYRRLEREGSIALEIGPDSPAFDFDTGKSFFAAYRLPDWPHPLEIRLTSRADVPLLSLMDANRPVFSPALLILDARFRVKRIVHEPEGLRVKAYSQSQGGPALEVAGEVYIGEASQEAAYLVILTTDELRARKVNSSGQTIDGFSPIGNLELEARSVPFAALPVRYRGRAMLVDKERDGAFSGVLFWRSNTLLISGNGLHYLEQQDGRYIERLKVPSAHIVAATVLTSFVLGARLELDTAQRPGDPLVRRTLALVPARDETSYQMDYVAGIAMQDVPLGWYPESVAIVAASSPPSVEFRDPPAVPSAQGSRIADKALSGGVVTAGICGVCQTGLCPPEMLLPCAGLFAIGAAVGGAVGIGGELLSGGFKPAPQAPVLPALQVQAATPVLSAAAGTLVAQDALRGCVLRRAAQGPAWVSQGRSAMLEPEPPAARFTVETAVHRVVLVPRSQPDLPIAEVPVQLIVEGGLVLRHTPARPGVQLEEPGEQRRFATWHGPSHTLAEWSAPDGRVLEATLREACDGLAAALLREAESLWWAAR